jgi:hypothetical protein
MKLMTYGLVLFSPEVQGPFIRSCEPERSALVWSVTRFVELAEITVSACPAAVHAVMLGVAVTVVVPPVEPAINTVLK